MSTELKFRGKFRTLPDGSREPEAAMPGIPASDLSDEDLQRLARQRGMTPAALRKELVGSGYYREATRKGKADEDEAGADDDSAGEPGDDNEDEESEEE